MYNMHNINMEDFDERIDNNIFSFFCAFCCAIFPAIPFSLLDIYYSLVYSIDCFDYTYLIGFPFRYWLLINGCVSLSTVALTFLVFVTSIYMQDCFLYPLFQNNIFIKGYIAIKLLFNIVWTMLGTVMFFKITEMCRQNIQAYVWIRIIIMYIFIVLSFRKIKPYLLNQNQSRNSNIIHANNSSTI